MKTKLTVSLLCLFLMTPLFAQYSVYTTYNIGSYLSHSENDLEIMQDQKLDNTSGFSLGVNIPFYKNIKAQIEKSVLNSEVKGTSTVLIVPSNPELDDFVERVNIFYKAYPIDLSIIPYSNNWFSAGIGPSLSFINRSLELNYPKEYGGKFKDKINIIGLGYNIFLRLSWKPFKKKENIEFFINGKLRRIDSSSITKDGRNLKNYSFDFTERFFSFGISWSFI